jgi:predicted Rossmann fold nucleotide-binding protein DprA/Smf involved in DNA uptake
LVTSVEDVLEELSISSTPEQLPLLEALETENEDETTVLGVLEFEPQHVDELSRATGLPVTRVTGALMVMEIRGQVRQVGRMNYIRAREARAAYRSTERL